MFPLCPRHILKNWLPAFGNAFNPEADECKRNTWRASHRLNFQHPNLSSMTKFNFSILLLCSILSGSCQDETVPTPDGYESDLNGPISKPTFGYGSDGPFEVE